MASSVSSAPAHRSPAFLFRMLNPVFTAILRSPIHRLLSRRLLLLTFRGRKSGRRYTVVVGYSQADGALLVGTESRWARNLRGGVPVTVRLRGRRRAGTANVIEDEAGMAERYRRMVADAPDYGRMIGVSLDTDGRPDSGDVRRAREAGHVLIEIRLA